MQTLFDSIIHLIINRPRIVLIVSGILALTSLVLALHQLRFDADQDNLISKQEAYHQRYKQYLQEFGDQEYIFVVIKDDPTRPDQIQFFIDRLASTLTKENGLFQKVIHRFDPNFLDRHGVYLLPNDAYVSLHNHLSEQATLLQSLLFSGNILTFLTTTNQMLGDTAPAKSSQDLEKGFAWIEQIMSHLDDPKALSGLADEPTKFAVFGPNNQMGAAGYISTENGHYWLIKILPIKDYSTSAVIAKPLAMLRSTIAKLKNDYPELEVGVTGRPVLQHDEMAASQEGSLISGILAFIGVSLLFLFSFREIRRPLLALIALLCGVSWTIGLVTLTVGHLNLLNLVFPIILVGLGIDFGIHFVFRYEHERSKSNNQAEALQKSLTLTGPAIIMGGITSAGAFLMAVFTDFLGLQELGFVAGMGIVLCLIAELVTLPALLRLFDLQQSALLPPARVYQYLAQIPRHKIPALICLAVITAALLPSLRHTSFEHNLLKLQNPHLESVQWEQRFIEETGQSTWQAVMLRDSLAGLEELNEKIRGINSFGHTYSLLDFVGAGPQKRRSQLQEVLGHFKAPDQAEPSYLKPALAELITRLTSLQGRAFEHGEIEATEKIDTLLDDLNAILVNYSPNYEQEVFSAYYQLSLNSYRALETFLSQHPPTLNDLPELLRSHLISTSGKFAYYIEPAHDIWDPKHREQFVKDLYATDPQVTGAPIQVYESAHRMQQGFYLIGWLTTCFVFILIAIDLRSIRYALLALSPVIMGLTWLLGLMGLLNIKINLGNFFALPILIGIGIDHGVHILHRFRELKDISMALVETSPPIIVSSLTTIFGFGSLWYVQHPGLQSFGVIMAMGSLTCLISTLLLIPVLLSRQQTLDAT